MRVRHPDAVDGESVDVNGTYVPVEDDGTFQLPEDAGAWLDRWLDANDYDRSDVVVDGDDGAPDVDEWHDWNEDDWLELDYQQRADDVRTGRVDDHLGDIRDVETSETVKGAVEARRSVLDDREA